MIQSLSTVRVANIGNLFFSDYLIPYLCILRFPLNRRTVIMGGVKSVIGRVVRALCVFMAAVAVLLSGTCIAIQSWVNKGSAKEKLLGIASEYVDCDLSIGCIQVSIFRDFPNLRLDIGNLALTYPHGKYVDAACPHSGHMENGQDTLASVRDMELRLRLTALLRGRIRLPSVSVGGLNLNAVKLDSSSTNWSIFKAEDNESESGMPNIIIDRLALVDGAAVGYVSLEDGLRSSVALEELSFEGHLKLSDPYRIRGRLNVRGLEINGQTARDELHAIFGELRADCRNRSYRLNAESDITLNGKDLGSLELPLALRTDLSLPEDGLTRLELNSLEAKAGAFEFLGNGDFVFLSDSTRVRAEVSIDSCPLGDVVHSIPSGILPGLRNFDTDAKADLTLLADGWYIPEKQSLPELIAELVIPRSHIQWEGLEDEGTASLDLEAMTDSNGKLRLDLRSLTARMAGIGLEMSGEAEDLLCEDPLLYIDLESDISLDRLGELLPEGMSARGNLLAAVSGYAFLSDLNPYNFGRADLQGFLMSDRIGFSDGSDELSLLFDNAQIDLAKVGSDSLLGAELLGLKGTVDSIYASLGNKAFVKGSGLDLSLQNAPGHIETIYGKEHHPLAGRLGAREIEMEGEDSLLVRMLSTDNSFRFSNLDAGGNTRPVLAVESLTGSISLSQGLNKAILNSLKFNASTAKRAQRERPQGARRSRRDSSRTEDDFRMEDLNLSISDNLAGYFREWNFSGELGLSEGLVQTPYFPIRNKISGLGGRFSDREVSLDSLTLLIGSSDLSARGRIDGIRPAVLRRGVLGLDLSVTSGRIDTDELMEAYTAGVRYASAKPVQDDSLSAAYADGDSLSNALIVIPSNINASIKLEGNEIDYSNLKIDWFESDIAMKNRTLQITNTVATSNMGDIYLEGFYSTRSRKDISAGFDLNMASITADKVIALFPGVNEIMPMLSSFKGTLDCEVAATSQLDTNMSFILPSINGVLNIKGTDLSMEDNEALDKLAKVLMFKERKMGRIEDMSVQGIISDNMLEVFPFVMKVDRYTLAMNGLQNFDQSFQYHVSVLRSPIPFRFGINLSGNFDDWKYRIGKAKYKNVNVPVFTAELKDMQMNLVSAIHDIFSRGVAAAVKGNSEAMEAIDGRKTALGYDSSADAGDMDPEDRKMLDSYIREQEEVEDLIQDETGELDLDGEFVVPDGILGADTADGQQ